MNGKQFVEELHEKYGLLEGYDIAEEYLALQKDTKDSAEIKFCREIREALDELDSL